jgi:ribosome-binding protein aMBF1 (putative translation factor)
MNDIKKYIEKRKKTDPDFAKDYELEYENFKVRFILRQARKDKGLTQEELAGKLKTKKSVISRIENYSRDIRLSTLDKYAKAVGRKIFIVFKKESR